MHTADTLTGHLWAAVTGEPQQSTGLRVKGQSGLLPSALAVEEVALSCVSVALMAAARTQSERLGTPIDATIERAHVAEAMSSEKRFVLAGEAAGMGFAPLSAFWRAADGWVRTHANYPWHREALLRALRVRENADPEVVRKAVLSSVRDSSVVDVEQRVCDQGGVAVAVRSVAEWRNTEQGLSVGQEDLVGNRVLPGDRGHLPVKTGSPLQGVRVLDLTRVIAGPVCTRYLGALGADVLRLDRADRLDMAPGLPADTLLGKRSAALDFRLPSGYDTLHLLLAAADVLVCGYRPGSLDTFGLTDEDLAERHPGLVVVRLAAWGHTGPWAGRRGFDSIVQAATGIAEAEGSPSRPGVLPCQVLDHGTGYLAAAAALDGLHRRDTEGGTQIRMLSLARTAGLLIDTPPPKAPDVAPHCREEMLSRMGSALGEVEAVSPPGVVGGQRLRWPSRATGYLDDATEWLGADV
ncbi:MAG: CoA transferase [Arachnia sp.]